MYVLPVYLLRVLCIFIILRILTYFNSTHNGTIRDFYYLLLVTIHGIIEGFAAAVHDQ
jgi:hypothetical protein